MCRALREWIDRQPRGTVRRLSSERNIREATWYEAADHGVKHVDVARMLSDATGGEVPASAILGLDDGHATPRIGTFPNATEQSAIDSHGKDAA